MEISFKKPVLGLLLGTGIGVGTLALAHSGVKDPIVMKRMMLMSSMAENTKTLGQMAKNQIPFDLEKAMVALDTLADLARKTPEAFKNPAQDPKSEAKALLWDEFDSFTALSNHLAQAADIAKTRLSTQKNLGPILASIGGQCKACHSEYREK